MALFAQRNNCMSGDGAFFEFADGVNILIEIAAEKFGSHDINDKKYMESVYDFADDLYQCRFFPINQKKEALKWVGYPYNTYKDEIEKFIDDKVKNVNAIVNGEGKFIAFKYTNVNYESEDDDEPNTVLPSVLGKRRSLRLQKKSLDSYVVAIKDFTPEWAMKNLRRDDRCAYKPFVFYTKKAAHDWIEKNNDK